MMKRFIVLLCLFLTFVSATIYADELLTTNNRGNEMSAAVEMDGQIKVTINGKMLVTDVAPQIVNDRTMLPMRAIFEALGARVTWIEQDKLIFAVKSDCLIVLKIDSNVMSVQKVSEDEQQVIELDSAAYISDGRTMVPVRAIAEALLAKVDWKEETKTVVITSEE